MRPSVRSWLLGLTASVVLCGGAAAQGTDPMFGVWKLNVAKSTYSPGPAPKEMTVTIEAAGPGRKVSVTGTNADGTPIKWGYSGNFDRKENKVTGTNPDGDVVMLRRVSARATRSTYKLAGKQTLVSGLSVSEDGKTLAVATTGVNAKGQTVKNNLILEKQ
jgi:hypothetical protein